MNEDLCVSTFCPRIQGITFLEDQINDLYYIDNNRINYCGTFHKEYSEEFILNFKKTYEFQKNINSSKTFYFNNNIHIKINWYKKSKVIEFTKDDLYHRENGSAHYESFDINGIAQYMFFNSKNTAHNEKGPWHISNASGMLKQYFMLYGIEYKKHNYLLFIL